MGGLTISFLAFLWPKLKGGFGTSFNVGTLEDLRTEIVQPDGTVVPKFVAAAQTWLISFPEDEMAGSSFEDLPVLVGAGGGEPGLMALWQRCVHLGCRVPSCVPSQGFECPCHGSRYNFHGEYEAGPAPRNLDRFEVSLTDAGELVVNTGAIFQTPRSKNKTATYPQGPSCV
jgi:cytochrome b6-f complex iron-sulfur subunit